MIMLSKVCEPEQHVALYQNVVGEARSNECNQGDTDCANCFTKLIFEKYLILL